MQLLSGNEQIQELRWLVNGIRNRENSGFSSYWKFSVINLKLNKFCCVFFKNILSCFFSGFDAGFQTVARVFHQRETTSKYVLPVSDFPTSL